MGMDHRQLLGRDVVSADGARLGHVTDLYIDPDTGAVRWLVLDGGLFSSGASFVPASGARDDEDHRRVVVAHTRRQIRRAPHPPADGDLTAEEEASLVAHYGDPVGVLPSPPAEYLADPTTTTDRSVVRSEEEVATDAVPRPVQRARLVKTVVTEDVTFTVPLRREVVRLVYEQIPDDEAALAAAASGRDAFEPVADTEIVLWAEVVEYEKRIVPKERVRLRHEVVPDVVDLRTDVRREEVDVADAGAT